MAVSLVKQPKEAAPARLTLEKTPRPNAPPHPALVEIVRLLARDAARRVRNDEG